MKVLYGSRSPGKDIQRGFELAQKTIELTNDSIGDPHILMSMLYSLSQKYEKAVEEAEKAVAISPNSADARRQLALVYNCVGRREEAIKAAKQSIRLNPHPDTIYFNGLGLAHIMAGQYEEAIEAFKKALHLNPKFNWSRFFLALAYSLSGLEKEAKAEVEEFLMLAPPWVHGKKFGKRECTPVEKPS